MIPRLEMTQTSTVYGRVDRDNEAVIIAQAATNIAMSLKSMKRVHAFLGKAIAYFESRAKKASK